MCSSPGSILGNSCIACSSETPNMRTTPSIFSLSSSSSARLLAASGSSSPSGRIRSPNQFHPHLFMT